MRKIFFWLLHRYSRNENQRLLILEKLWGAILTDYYEQTLPGNVYNFQIEVVISNPWIRYAASTFDKTTSKMILSNISAGSEAAIKFIETEDYDNVKDTIEAMNKFHTIKFETIKK